MQPTVMHLKVLLPFQVFAEKTGVTRIVAAQMPCNSLRTPKEHQAAYSRGGNRNSPGLSRFYARKGLVTIVFFSDRITGKVHSLEASTHGCWCLASIEPSLKSLS